jgi:hypothetical protein
MSTLANIVNQSIEISNEINRSMGELTPELESKLDLNSADLSEKIDCYVGVLKHLEKIAMMYKENADEMKARQKTLENQLEKLRERLKTAHTVLGLREIEGMMFKTLVYESQPKLVIENEKSIPSKYMKVVQKIEIDKDAIKAALLDGETIDGCRFELTHALRISVNAKERLK